MDDKLQEIKEGVARYNNAAWRSTYEGYTLLGESSERVAETALDWCTDLLQVVEEQKKELDRAVNLLENTKKNTSGIWRISINDFLRNLGKE